MKLKSIVLVSFCLASFCARAQEQCSCSAYHKISDTYSNDSIRAINLWKEKNTICKAKGYEKFALHLLKINVLDSVLYHLERAKAIYDKTTCGDSVYMQTYKFIAQYYYTTTDFAKCQEYSLKLLKSAEHSKNTWEIASCYTMIAQVFNQTGQAEKGIIYTRKASALLPKIKEVDNKIDMYYRLSKRYLWHYQDTKFEGSLDSSKKYSIIQLGMAKKVKDNYYISNAFNNLQGIEYEKANYAKAMSFIDSAYLYSDKVDYSSLGMLFFDKADLLIEMKNWDKADLCADSTIFYYLKTKNKAYIAEAYMLKERIAKLSGNYKEAYEYKSLSTEILDSIKTVEKAAAVSLLEKKYNQAKNEEKIKELATQKQIYLLLALAGLLAATTIAFFLRQQKLKHKKDILETEQRLNRARMNPHFFFNALASLQKFALRDNDGQAIASSISKFSHIMRETLESTYKEYVTVEQEMDFLNEYLELQKIRFPQMFAYEVQADDDLEIDDVLIPAMILQPFVENSVEHGFAGIDYPGNVSVLFGHQDQELMVTIKDNGNGLNITAKESHDHISRASQIIKDRIYLLNIKLKTKAGFKIDNNENGKGVIVKIHLPLLYKSQQIE